MILLFSFVRFYCFVLNYSLCLLEYIILESLFKSNKDISYKIVKLNGELIIKKSQRQTNI